MRRNTRSFAALLIVVVLAGTLPARLSAQEAEGAAAPKVFLDKSRTIVTFQLKRLTNPQLLAVERTTDHPKYAPVYEAILTRKDMERKFRQEAADGLAALNKSDAVVEILGGIGKTDEADAATRSDLVGLLLTQRPEALAGQKGKIAALARESESTSLKEAAYAALVVADGNPDAVWRSASATPGAMPLVLGGVAMLPDAKLKAAFHKHVAPLVDEAPDDATRIAAVDALGFIPGHEVEAFAKLAELSRSQQPELRAAAVRSLRRIASDKWPKGGIAPLAEAVVKLVGETPADQRTTPAMIETIQLGEELAAALPPEQGTPVRKALRELAVRTILVRTLREQMAYDLRYFVVQAGKPVRIMLDNPDGMPHNLVVTAPGAVQEVGIAGGSMQPPNDPAVKPFVPASPKVLHATQLVQPGQSDTLKFAAPAEPGEYGYVCTFPGHWMRMYGVMLVVPDLDAYELAPTVPTDPLTNKPFESAKLTSAETAEPGSHAH